MENLILLSIKDILIFIFGIIGFMVLCFGSIILAKEIYDWVRRKMNRPKIGREYFLSKMLKRDDYVSIEGKILEFNHFAHNGQSINSLMPPSHYNSLAGGELGFRGRGLGYIYYERGALNNCEFIYGKYGLKWAASEYWARVAEEKKKQNFCEI